MTTQDNVREAVLTAARKITKNSEFSATDDDTFADLGLDSLDRMSLLVEVETLLEVELGEVDPDKLSSIGDYIHHLQA